MSLIDDIKSWYEEESYPPDGEDVAAELVSERNTGNLRWGTGFINVYHREGEFVAVEDVAPATEYQSWGDYGPPDIYHVEAYEVTVTKYRKI